MLCLGLLLLPIHTAHILLSRLLSLLLPLLVKSSIVLLEVFLHQLVIVDDLLPTIMLYNFAFLEYLIDILGVELYMRTHSFHPYLVHFVEIFSDNLSYFELKDRDVFV